MDALLKQRKEKCRDLVFEIGEQLRNQAHPPNHVSLTLFRRSAINAELSFQALEAIVVTRHDGTFSHRDVHLESSRITRISGVRTFRVEQLLAAGSCSGSWQEVVEQLLERPENGHWRSATAKRCFAFLNTQVDDVLRTTVSWPGSLSKSARDLMEDRHHNCDFHYQRLMLGRSCLLRQSSRESYPRVFPGPGTRQSRKIGGCSLNVGEKSNGRHLDAVCTILEWQDRTFRLLMTFSSDAILFSSLIKVLIVTSPLAESHSSVSDGRAYT
jgi:hypothetical protein